MRGCAKSEESIPHILESHRTASLSRCLLQQRFLFEPQLSAAGFNRLSSRPAATRHHPPNLSSADTFRSPLSSKSSGRHPSHMLSNLPRIAMFNLFARHPHRPHPPQYPPHPPLLLSPLPHPPQLHLLPQTAPSHLHGTSSSASAKFDGASTLSHQLVRRPSQLWEEYPSSHNKTLRS